MSPMSNNAVNEAVARTVDWDTWEAVSDAILVDELMRWGLQRAVDLVIHWSVRAGIDEAGWNDPKEPAVSNFLRELEADSDPEGPRDAASVYR